MESSLESALEATLELLEDIWHFLLVLSSPTSLVVAVVVMTMMAVMSPTRIHLLLIELGIDLLVYPGVHKDPSLTGRVVRPHEPITASGEVAALEILQDDSVACRFGIEDFGVVFGVGELDFLVWHALVADIVSTDLLFEGEPIHLPPLNLELLPALVLLPPLELLAILPDSAHVSSPGVLKIDVGPWRWHESTRIEGTCVHAHVHSAHIHTHTHAHRSHIHGVHVHGAHIGGRGVV